MKVLQVHNYYQQAGGEDVVVHAERQLLQQHGQQVVVYERDNAEINDYSLLKKVSLIWRTAWSADACNDMRQLLEQEQPDVCHVHNVLPLITPSVYHACHAAGVPVVQTLHNYRGVCSGALLLRDGKVCDECISRSAYHSVKYGCYRNSRVQTLAVAHMLESHKRRGTWANRIDAYIALTSFAKDVYAKKGFPADKLIVKPNFLVDDPGAGFGQREGFVFVGRLDPTKGTQVLARAADALRPDLITVIGDGPETESLRGNTRLTLTGRLPRDEIFGRLQSARALVFPSIWYEGMPMTILEAFACGCPVIASRLGGPDTMIDDRRTGLLFNPGDSIDLARKLEWADQHPEEMAEMGRAARDEFEEKYTARRNYEQLMSIYESVTAAAGAIAVV